MFSKAQIVSLIDLTSLNDSDTPASIEKLCEKATTPLGNVAAVCIYPKFVSQAKEALKNTDISIATVVNFPSGNSHIDAVLLEIEQALEAGADEIDMVIPYEEYNATGQSAKTIELVHAAKKKCGNKLLKVIIESGVLKNADLIEKVAQDVIQAGADFIKTSTGKVSVGATLPAAEIMLKTLVHGSEGKIGFKASGGVKNYQQACQYLALAKHICGIDFICKKRFRFGASSLLGNLLESDEVASSY